MSEGVYHIPVLLKESVDALNINPNGVYVDVTFGGGGHSREILTRLDQGRLFAFDQDPDAHENAIDDPCFTLISANFRFIGRFLRLYGIKQVDGILADLGVSSHQFDAGERGFSIRFDADLDMRMSQNGDLTAKKIINEWEAPEMSRIFKVYGELQNAKRIAKAIEEARQETPIETTMDLIRATSKLAPAHKPQKFQAQLFQALRIAVNAEMEALEEMLDQTAPLLKTGGRLSVITYHSLEDRMVKYYMRSGKKDGEVKKDFFGRHITPFKPLVKGNTPSEEEISNNPRARSAKLRVAERIDEQTQGA